MHVSLLGKGLEINVKRLPERPCGERWRRRTGVPERLHELVEAAASTGGLRSESAHLAHPVCTIFAQIQHIIITTDPDAAAGRLRNSYRGRHLDRASLRATRATGLE